MPSVSSEAKASDSACAQSMPPSAPSASRRRSSCLTSLGCTVKPSGTASSSSLSELQPVDAETAVLTSGEGVRSSWYSPVGCSTSPASAAALICALSFWCSEVSSSQTSLFWRSTSSAVTTPCSTSRSAQMSRDALLLLDARVHLGLRVGGLVGLVVAEAAVADQVDDDVVAELLAEGEGEADGGDAGRHVVGVDVDDRHVVALGEVGGPPGRARVVGVGREADLVVLDEVQRAADRVAVQRLQVQRLGDDALAGEGRVAVQDDRHGRVGVAVGVRALARGLRGARGADDDGVHVLQVRRVGLEVDEDR